MLNLLASPTHRVPLADGTRIAVWDSGERELQAVVLVHGFPENRLCWEPVLEKLQNEVLGFRWVVYDLRGFGLSDRMGEASWKQMVADHLGITHALGLQGQHLLGHDWGAAIALHVARVAPEILRSVCVLNTSFWKMDVRGMWHVWVMNVPVLPSVLFRLTPDWFFERTMVRSFNDPGRMSPESRASYLEMFRDRSTTKFWVRLYRTMARFMIASSVMPAFKERFSGCRAEIPPTSSGAFELPFQLIWGVDDTFCPLWVGRTIEKRLRGYGAEVGFHEVADSGHFVTEEQPEEVAGIVAGWLRRWDAGAGET